MVSDLSILYSGFACALDVFDEHRFRGIPNEFHGLIDHGFRHASNGIPLRELGKFAHFHNIRHDMRIRDRHFEGQTGHTGTMRSGRRDKDLEMKILFQIVQYRDGFFREIHLCFGHIDQSSEQD